MLGVNWLPRYGFWMNMAAKPKAVDTKKARTAISPTRAENFPEWYQQIIKEADMADMSGVRGCMVIKPWGYAIWERIQAQLDLRIKATGHDNCYFPLFIPLSYFQKEADHVEGFAKEMAVVTHHRLINQGGKLVPDPDSKLEEPLIVRPTSEMIIAEAMAKEVQSYRDLPLLWNQWANVVRWEMRPRVFLRTAEFLWQEGHTAHETEADAREETLRMLEVYRQMFEDIMALPVILGTKSEGERFPGAVETYTLEAMMQDGKSLQAATSHYLGQNFARASNISFQDREGKRELVHTTSWGLSTRSIGGIIMTHADDDGLQLPPRLAPVQIIIVPILKDEAENQAVLDYADKLVQQLQSVQFAGENIRIKLDRRDQPASDKRWQYIKKGVPLIVEIGPKDLAGNSVAVTRRDKLAEKKAFIAFDEFVTTAPALLQSIQESLHARADANRAARMKTDIQDIDDLKQYFAADENYDAAVGFVRGKWCGDANSENLLKPLGLSIRCLPLDQTGTEGKCVLTGKPGTIDAIFAKSY